MKAVFLILVAVLCAAQSRSADSIGTELNTDNTIEHKIKKRFVNPTLASGGFSDSDFSKIRAKRNVEDCEKLRLCRLHARSNRNFFSAFELYFVNRETARLWDHQARTLEACSQRFSCYR